MSFRERALIRRLRERDENGFRELVGLYQDRVFRMTYRMLNSREEAEDLAQEVFVTVFKSIDSFRGDAKFSTWLFRITANHCKNRIKYLARRHDRDSSTYDESHGDTAAGTTHGKPPSSPAEKLANRQMGSALHEAIARLNEDHRILIVLRDIEELSYDEISGITGIAEGTIKSRIHRARLQLRAELQHVTRG